MPAKRSVVIALFVGGAWRGAVSNLNIAGADLGIYMDVPREIEGITLDNRVIVVPLAEGETIGSLLDRVPDSVDLKTRKLLNTRAGDLASGLGQTPVLGAMAYEALKRSGRLEPLWQEVLDKVKQLTNGAPELIILLVLRSDSGGTGRGTALQAMQDLINFLEETEAVIKVQHLRVGAQTFTGLGHHIPLNNSVGVVEDLTAVQKPSARRVVPYLFGVELPMVGEDTVARDRYAQLFLQAWTARGVQEMLARFLAAPMVTGELFGRICVSQAGFWRMPENISPEASAAAKILPPIQALVSDHSGSTGILHNFELRISAQATPERPVDRSELLTMARTPNAVLPPDYWKRYIAQKYKRSGEVGAILANQAMPLETMLASLPNTIGPFRDRRRFLFGLFEELQHRLGVVRGTIDENQLRLERVRRDVENVLRRLFPKSYPTRGHLASLTAFLQSVVSLFAGVRGRLGAVKSLEKFLNTYSRLEAELEELKAREEALSRAADTVQQKLREHEATLERIRRWLLEATQREGIALNFFRIRNLDDGVLRDLLLASQSNSRAYFEIAVRRSLAGVTRQGLGAILLGGDAIGASDLSAELLALKLAEEPPEITPPWGGKIRRDRPLTAVVIPPVTPDLLEELRIALTTIGSDLQIITTDTVSGGVAAVLLKIYPVKNRSDLLTRQYYGGLVKAVRDGWYPLARVTGGADTLVRELKKQQAAQRQGAKARRKKKVPGMTTAATSPSSGNRSSAAAPQD